MTNTEAAVLVGGALLGYWIVASFMTSKSGGNKAQDEVPRLGRTEEGGPDVESGSAPGANWFDVLEVGEDATAEDIRGAYQKKISQYHRDKVATLGVEFRRLAEERTKQINAAYDHAMKLRGQS